MEYRIKPILNIYVKDNKIIMEHLNIEAMTLEEKIKLLKMLIRYCNNLYENYLYYLYKERAKLKL